MKDQYKIIDNFLSNEDFIYIKNYLTSADMAWYYNEKINSHHQEKDLTCYFTHSFFNNSNQSYCFKYLIPILNKLNIKALIRVKGNLYPKTNKLEIHKPHIDYPFIHNACIFYINTNDGKTILENGAEIESIENRMLFFDAHKEHKSTNTTNQKARININFNYF
jgi:hypothetical protein